MNKTGKRLIRDLLVAVMLLSGVSVSSQTISSFPYFNGFEDSSQDGEWVFVNGTSVNKWYIHTGVASQGSRGLYVSGDGGLSPSYQNVSCGIGVYREIILPAGAQYRVSFDWKVQGQRNESSKKGIDSLYVYWVSDPTEPIYPNVTGDVPANLVNYKRGLHTTDYLKDGNFWNNSSFIVNGSPTARKLLFYWTNDGSNNFPPAACIDNIQIEKITDQSCLTPAFTSVVFEGGVQLTWTGNSSGYKLKYYHYQTNTWTDVSETILGSPYTVTGLEKGFYRFWLQGICDTDTTAWAVSSNFITAVGTDKCLNYSDLTNSKFVHPTYSRSYENPTAIIGLHDEGYQSPFSQHTLHYLKTETDPRTLGQLKTVPDDEVVSVRLGNWRPGNESEAITYTFTVNEATPILLIKYAPVLHDGNHDGQSNVQPRFILRVTDILGRPLDEQCLSARFLADRYAPGWDTVSYASIDKQYLSDDGRTIDYPIVWKNWTSVGMNLRKYVGQQLKVYMETGDCMGINLDGHFGYAYFTLDCVSDKMEGLTCGAAAEEIDTVWAPKGYSYEWYRITSPTIIRSTERYFVPLSGDTATYKCRMTFAEAGKENCYFELTAALLPRYPAADASYTVCQRTVQFTDKSHIFTQNGIIDELPDVYWDFGDTIVTDRNPVYEFPATGTYKVVQHATIQPGDCDSTWTHYITVNDDTVKTYIDTTLCRGQRYTFGERELIRAGLYTDTLTTAYGCDSIAILDLKFFNTIGYDTICGGQNYVFEGEELTLGEGLHELVYKNIKSVFGCDSILSLYVTQGIAVSSDNEICTDETGTVFTLTSGMAESVEIEFDAKTLTAGFENTTLSLSGNSFTINLPANIRAGKYGGRFLFKSSYCGDSEVDFTFTVRYRADIIIQRWNDVLLLTNSDYNGGYTFSAYQWYKDGEAIPNATKSYYYSQGENLDFTASYTVEITRLDDGEVIVTCPFTPTQIPESMITIRPTMVRKGENIEINVPQSGVAEVYSTMGIKLNDFVLKEGVNTVGTLLDNGLYLVNIRLADGTYRTFRINVKD